MKPYVQGVDYDEIIEMYPEDGEDLYEAIDRVQFHAHEKYGHEGKRMRLTAMDQGYDQVGYRPSQWYIGWLFSFGDGPKRWFRIPWKHFQTKFYGKLPDQIKKYFIIDP